MYVTLTFLISFHLFSGRSSLREESKGEELWELNKDTNARQIVLTRTAFVCSIEKHITLGALLTLMSRLRPKLNFTKNQNIMPANINLITFPTPPTPAYAPYWTWDWN